MRYLAIILCLFAVLTAKSQSVTWERLYTYPTNDGSAFNSVDETLDGNIIAQGVSILYNSTWEEAPFFLKYDLDGNVAWTKFGWKGYECGGQIYVKQLKDGGFVYSTCERYGGAKTRIVLQKMDMNGDTIPHWIYGNKNYSNGTRKIIELPNGDIINAGRVEDNFALLKINNMGDSIWLKSYPSSDPPNDQSYDVIVNSKGNYVLGGQSITYPAYDKIHRRFLELSPDGDTIRSKTVVAKNADIDEQAPNNGTLLETSKGDYIFTSLVDTLNSSSIVIGVQPAVTLTDSAFNKKWTTILPAQFKSYSYPMSVFEMEDSSFVAAMSEETTNKFFIFRLSKNGQILSKKTYTSTLCNSLRVEYARLVKDSIIIVWGGCNDLQNAYIARIDTMGKAMPIDTCKSFKATFSAEQIGDTIYFSNTSKGGYAYADQSLWKFSDSTASSAFNPKIEVIGTQDSIWARLIATNPYGCKDTIEKKVKVFHPTGTTDPVSDENWKVIVYPNPSSAIFNFKNIGNISTNFKLSLINSIGQEVGNFSFSSKEFLVNANLSSGMYFYLLRDEKGNARSGKLIVE